MSGLERAILWVYGVIVAAWLLRHVVFLLIQRRLHFLVPDSPRFESHFAPLVTAVIPAKDEEAVLSDCLESVCAQSYAKLQVLVVDDRSTDGTAEIARRFERADPRVRLISIQELPPGWTGKTHALQQAVGEARGDWFWFLDADTRHHSDALSIALRYAHDQHAALVSLMPELRCGTFWEKVLQPLEAIVLMRSFSPLAVNDDRSKVGFANGQFLLIERAAYEAAGGHHSVRDRFVEDIYISQRVKSLGYPIRVAMGVALSSTRMYTSLSQIVRGWSRILYDALGRRAMPLVWKIVEPLVFSQSGDLAFVVGLVLVCLGWAGPFGWGLLLLSVVHQVLKTTLLYRMYKLMSPASAGHAALYTIAGVVSVWISLVAIHSCLTGRVTWRGTQYRPTESSASASPIPSSTLP